MLGKISRVNEPRGFGFLRPLDSSDCDGDHFFHISALVGLEFGQALVGKRVEFVSARGDKGLFAREVKAAE